MQRKSLQEQAKKLTFRNSEIYADEIAAICKEIGITPNKFGKLASLMAAKHNVLNINTRLLSIEHGVIRILKILTDNLVEVEQCDWEVHAKH